MRRLARFPLSLLFLISLVPIAVISVRPDLWVLEDGHALEVPFRLLILPAYLLVAYAELVTGIEYPWSLAVILPFLLCLDLILVAGVRRLRGSAA